MTQNYAVEQKRPSVLPRMIVGTGVGAAAGWGLSKIDALKAPKYSSFYDILADSKDIFEAAKKDGASEEVKNLAQTVRENVSNFYKGIKPTVDAVKNTMTAEKTTLAEAKTKFKDLWTNGVNDVITKIKSGDVKIDGFDAAAADEKAILNQARKYLRGNMTDELKNAQNTLKEAANKLKFGNLEFSEDQKKVITEKVDDAWKAVKDKVKDVKVPKTKMFLGIGAGVGLLLALLLRPKAKKEEV